MTWTPTFQPGWTNFQTHLLTQGPDLQNEEAIKIMQNYEYPAPERYEFIQTLGAGGCGKVYLAKHILTGCLYAVKCVKIIDRHTAAMARGLMNEIDILKSNPHQHIITYVGSMQSSDRSLRYLWMEYMDMGSVRQMYLKSKYTNITEDAVRMCISQVLFGLEHLHTLSIVHRDIKGDNILKDSKGYFKIADFGLTKKYYEDPNSGIFGLMTAGMGTYTHMAPEVMNRHLNVPYDMQADIWSLGCLVLEIFSKGQFTVKVDGQLAIYTDPYSVTPQCKDFIWRCLQVKPGERHTSRMLLNHDWFKIDLRIRQTVAQTI